MTSTAPRICLYERAFQWSDSNSHGTYASFLVGLSSDFPLFSYHRPSSPVCFEPSPPGKFQQEQMPILRFKFRSPACNLINMFQLEYIICK